MFPVPGDWRSKDVLKLAAGLLLVFAFNVIGICAVVYAAFMAIKWSGVLEQLTG